MFETETDASARARRMYDRGRYVASKRAIHAYLGSCCAACGETRDLEIDHIDRSTKKFNPLARWGSGWDEIRPELDKCQLLCRVCHRRKTALEFGRSEKPVKPLSDLVSRYFAEAAEMKYPAPGVDRRRTLPFD